MEAVIAATGAGAEIDAIIDREAARAARAERPGRYVATTGSRGDAPFRNPERARCGSCGKRRRYCRCAKSNRA